MHLYFLLLPFIQFFQYEQITTYRSDQFRPGVISEYIMVEYNEARDSIKGISYKYVYRSRSAAEESSLQSLKTRNIAFYSRVETGWKGQLRFPTDEEWLDFRIVEGVFEIDHPNDNIQVFEKEE